MENKEQESATPSGDSTTQNNLSGLTKFISFVTGFSVIAGVGLHFLGNVAHWHYLKLCGIDSGLFPKAADWTAIRGYYTMFERITSVFEVMIDAKVIGVLFITTVVTALYIFLVKKVNERKIDSWLAKYLTRMPDWLRKLCCSLLIGGITVITVPLILLWIAVVLAIPAVIGETSGTAAAKADFKVFQKGCEKAPPSYVCFELAKDGKSLGKGFLIDGSEPHLAFFDVVQQKVRVVERSGTEQIAVPANIFHSKPQIK